MHDYKAFLSFLSGLYDIRPLKDHAKRRGNASVCLLRHDVDDYYKALSMAKSEADMGIRSTYFVLPSTKQFDPDIVADIQGLGHEIGLHNDVLTRCFSSRRVGYSKRLFESELAILDGNNITVRGVSSHNSELCNKYGVHNHDIFKEYHNRGKPERVRHTELFTVSLKKYGLYEAGLLFTEHTFTDTGGEWSGGEPANSGISSYLRNAASVGHTVIQIIVHPSEWDF